MAEFNVDLAPPQGQGSQPVAPVERGSALAGTDNLFNMLATGYKKYLKGQQEEMQNAVLQEYSKKMSTISDAVSTGSYNAQRGGSEVRRLNSQFMAQYPQYVEELKKINSFFMGGTDAGMAVDAEKEEIRRENVLLDDAAKNGFPTFKGMSKEGREAIIAAHQAQTRAKAIFDEQRKLSEEIRSQGKYDREVDKEARSRASVSLLNEIGKSNVMAFQTFVQELAKSNMPREEALALMDRQMAQLRIGVDSVAREFPELASSTRSLIEDIYKTGKEAFDPNKNANEAEAKFKELMAKGKVAALMSDPKIKNLAIANSLFPNTPIAQLEATSVVGKVLRMSNEGESSTDTIIGSEDEQGVLRMLKAGLIELKGGKIPEKEKATIEASKSFDALFKDVGRVVNTGTYDTKPLGEVAKIVASPDYLWLSKNGKISKEAALAARDAIGKGLYQPAAEEAAKLINSALSGDFLLKYVGGGRGNSVKSAKFEPWMVKDFINISFDGEKVVFVPKDVSALDPNDRAALNERLKSLNSVGSTMSVFVKATAHLEQSTDYKDTFERYKHVLFPYQYSKYKDIEIGETRKGPDGKLYRYTGGDINVGNNWKPTGD
jgi:hypothetical protein